MSGLFRDMFSLPAPTVVQGETVENPIVIPQVLAKVFDMLLVSAGYSG
jgi:hypothetical protein